MNLHRITGSSDWEDTPQADRTSLQRLAASTNGIITVGNAITAVGFVLVCWGLIVLAEKHYSQGLLLIVIGRLGDVLDGYVADITKTKSRLGEILDASIDKVVTGLTLITLVVAEIIPWWIALALLLPHVIITCFGAYGLRRNIRLHPSQAGKLSMAVGWLTYAAFLLVKIVPAHMQASVHTLAYVLAGISAAAGLYTAYGYRKVFTD
jgi:phosphatidylglycerophosphate synthase